MDLGLGARRRGARGGGRHRTVLRVANSPPPDGCERVLSARRRLRGSAPGAPGEPARQRSDGRTNALSVCRPDCAGTGTGRRTRRPRRRPGQLATPFHADDHLRDRPGANPTRLYRLLLATGEHPPVAQAFFTCSDLFCTTAKVATFFFFRNQK